MATGGMVVVGAGAASGLIVADMHSTWAKGAALDAAAETAAQAPDLGPVRPDTIILIEERHVTPKPVEVHKKVYRTRVVGGSSSGGTSASQRRTTSQPRTTAAKPTRTVVAPAPKAPAPSTKTAPAKTTSKKS